MADRSRYEKNCFYFPGQGSQYAGMGKDFYDTYSCAKEMIDLASEVSGHGYESSAL